MMVATAQLSESLQSLIDTRLDTIDRMLLGRVSRYDRLAIGREVESQIHELLQASSADELTREDVLAVLARLDPPEAYLPESTESEGASARRVVPVRVPQSVVKDDPKVGRASGTLGLAALAFMLLMPVSLLIAETLNSRVAMMFLPSGAFLLMIVASVLGLTLGVVARKSGPWAAVGIVTSVLAVLLSLSMALTVVLLN